MDFSKRLTHEFAWKLERFLLIVFCQNRIRKNAWRCFQRLKRPKRACIKTFILGVSYWIFPKVNPWLWVKIGKFPFDFFCQNRISKDAWRCFRRWSRPKRAFIARIFLRVIILNFSKEVSPCMVLSQNWKVSLWFCVQNRIRKDVWCATGLNVFEKFPEKVT